MEAGRVYGATRLVLRTAIGLASCGTECKLDPADSANTLLGSAGLGVGIERVLAHAKRWSLGLGGGYFLRTYTGLSGSFDEAFRHGPYATLRVLHTKQPPPELLDPNARGGSGVEILVERVTGDAFGSGYRAGLSFVFVFP
jgi:hypothetical protein